VVDDAPQSHWVHDLIARSRTSDGYAIALLIVQTKPAPEATGSATQGVGYLNGSAPGTFLKRACFRLIARLEHVVVARMTGFRGFFKTYPLDLFAIPKVFVHPVLSGCGRYYRYTRDDLAVIRDQNLDVLLRCDREGILPDEILNACEFGVISLAYSCNCAIRGGPPAFWEVYQRDPCTGFAIQRLRDESSRAETLLQGVLNTAPLYLHNALNLFRKSNFFVHRFLENLARNRRLPPALDTVCHSEAPPRRAPDLRHQVLYLYRTFTHFAERAFRRSLGVRWRWGTAYQFGKTWEKADLSRSMVIRNPGGRYLADPFVVTRNGSSVCFVEDYDCSTSKARITALRLGPNQYEELGVALAEPFHLSYPYVFEVGDDLYMCPETQEAGDIRLYKCIEFPLRWRLHRVLMNEVAAVDTNIVFHDGRWWMLTNIDSSDIGDYRSELHVFYADTFDSDRWHPHPANPVIFDSSRARNGGMFSFGGDLYRVFQVQGFDIYGESMGVALIRELSTDRYREEPVETIGPTFFPGIVGTHTLSFDGQVLAFDFVRRERCGR
jgi:hypothetical protein